MEANYARDRNSYPTPSIPLTILYRVQWGSFFVALVTFFVIMVWTEYYYSPSNRYFEHYVPKIDQASIYPYKVQETVNYAVMMLTFVPCIVFWILLIELKLIKKCKVILYKWMTALNLILAMVECTLLTIAATQLVKYKVGFLRPDFAARCFGAGKTYEDLMKLTLPVACTETDSHLIREGKLSFPSGHASTAMSFGCFLSFYLLYCLYVRGDDRYRWHEKSTDKKAVKRIAGMVKPFLFVVALFPLMASVGVALSRITDFRHSPLDVTAGVGIGCFFGIFIIIRTIIHERTYANCEAIECDIALRRSSIGPP